MVQKAKEELGIFQKTLRADLSQPAPNGKLTQTALPLQFSQEQVNNLSQYMSYLQKNSDQIPGDIVAELNKSEAVVKDTVSPIADIDRAMKQELALAYDWMSQALEYRAQTLNQRLKHLFKSFGTEAQVLLQNKNFEKEPEDIDFDLNPSIGERTFSIEDVSSLNNQIQNILKFKDKDNIDIYAHQIANLIGDFSLPEANMNREQINSSPVNENLVHMVNQP